MMSDGQRGTPLRSISAVLSVSDGSRLIGPLLEALVEHLEDLVPEFEVHIVVDGAGEGAVWRASEAVERHAEVHIHRQARRLGQGAVWRIGIDLATKQYIAFIDTSRRYDPANLVSLAEWGDRYDLVAGYRQLRGYRRALSWLWRTLAGLTLGVQGKDLACSMILVRTSLAKRIHVHSSGTLVIAELRLRAQLLGASTREVAVRYASSHRQVSTGARAAAMLRTLGDAVALRRRLRQERREQAATPILQEDAAAQDNTASSHEDTGDSAAS